MDARQRLRCMSDNSWWWETMAMERNGDIVIGNMVIGTDAHKHLRDALGIQPDPAAEARATLEQAREDDVVETYQQWAPNPPESPMWRLYLYYYGCGNPQCFYGVTEAEALAAAAAHVEELRKPKLPEPEEMRIASVVRELRERGWARTSNNDQVAMWSRIDYSDYILIDDDETWADFNRRALREARKQQ